MAIAHSTACASNDRLRKMGCVLLTECIFPQSYTKFEIETMAKQGDAPITEGAHISVRKPIDQSQPSIRRKIAGAR